MKEVVLVRTTRAVHGQNGEPVSDSGCKNQRFPKTIDLNASTGRATSSGRLVDPQMLELEEIEHFCAALVKPLSFSRLVPSECVRCDQRKSDGRVQVANDGIGQPVGVYFAPAHCL